MRPIIVLGAARSGTKFLRDVLAASSGAAVVPYDVNFIWRSGNEDAPDDVLGPDRHTEAIGAAIRSRLGAAAGLRADENRRLLEKTVSNTVRVPFVARVFPDADFVHIVRDGREVVESSLRQWSAPTDWRYVLRKAWSFPPANYRYALWYLANRLKGRRGTGNSRAVWGVRYPGIEADLAHLSVAAICARQWVESVERVRQVAPTLARFREVRYEDLVGNESVVAGLAEWLQLPARDAVLARYRSTVQHGPSVRWDGDLMPADAQATLAIIAPTLRKLGYS